MDKIHVGWRIGGRMGAWLAVSYALVAAVVFYAENGLGSSRSPLWMAEKPSAVNWLNSGLDVLLLTAFLSMIPVTMAWLAGSLAGALTGVLAGALHGAVARLWGMVCFSLPPVAFHAVAELRPTLVLSEHWLNSYWFWVGLPSVICVLVGGWVGVRLASHARLSMNFGHAN